MAVTEPAPEGPTVHDWGVEDLPGLEFDPFLAYLLHQEPIARIRLPYGEGHAWLVTRYHDVQLVTSDARFSRRAPGLYTATRMSPHVIAPEGAVTYTDPPDHTRLRKTVARAFTPRGLERIRVPAQLAADTLLNAVERQGPPADLAALLHGPLPLTIISGLMGVPEEDRPRVAEWTDLILSTGHGQQRSESAQAAMRAYFADLLARRRGDPREDLASDLAAATLDGSLGEDEAVAVGVMVQISATDSVRSNSANMVYALLTHPDELARLRADPALLPQAVEELLRYIPHRRGVGVGRVATEDVEVSGTLIARGEVVYASYLTANRDPAVFDRPDELDFGRGHIPHVSFGHGPHFCMGAMLARMESEIIISGLLARFPGLRLAVPVEEIGWRRGALIRGPQTLPVTW